MFSSQQCGSGCLVPHGWVVVILLPLKFYWTCNSARWSYSSCTLFITLGDFLLFSFVDLCLLYLCIIWDSYRILYSICTWITMAYPRICVVDVMLLSIHYANNYNYVLIYELMYLMNIYYCGTLYLWLIYLIKLTYMWFYIMEPLINVISVALHSCLFIVFSIVLLLHYYHLCYINFEIKW